MTTLRNIDVIELESREGGLRTPEMVRVAIRAADVTCDCGATNRLCMGSGLTSDLLGVQVACPACGVESFARATEA